MDPRSARRSAGWRCFPRTRGDGPTGLMLPSGSGPFPPHSRGWTGTDRGDRASPEVSPALAGMDPRSSLLRTPSRGFPRTRGDGPVTVTVTPNATLFPPHSRGWTRRSDARAGREHVSPALAGMDPRPARRSAGWRCFPRTRGDGPSASHSRLTRGLFPPHSRGWTRLPRGALERRGVSPALAGMDLTLRVEHTPKSCFPPHSRGWTLSPDRPAQDLRVSPALAGMDLCHTRSATRYPRFPRTRGDGP